MRKLKSTAEAIADLERNGGLKVVRPQTCVYLPDGTRASLSRHTGTPILEEYNPIYDYWATVRELTEAEVVKHLGANYVRNMRGRS